MAGLKRAPGAPWETGPRAAMEWAAGLEYRAVQLDGTVAGTRARELDRSARRDVGGVLRRLSLVMSGIDLWIPPTHFSSPGDVDRAVAAVVGAVELAADLRAVVPGSTALVCVSLPAETVPGVESALGAAAQRFGCVVADHAWPVRENGVLEIGVDPATLILAGVDVPLAVAGLRAAPASARMSDLAAEGRVLPGDGALEPFEYDAALSVRGFSGARIVDLRGLPDQERAVGEIRRRLIGAAG